jgi:hypothetical protein
LFRLKAAVGQLTENDVASVNEWINGKGR